MAEEDANFLDARFKGCKLKYTLIKSDIETYLSAQNLNYFDLKQDDVSTINTAMEEVKMYVSEIENKFQSVECGTKTKLLENCNVKMNKLNEKLAEFIDRHNITPSGRLCRKIAKKGTEIGRTNTNLKLIKPNLKEANTNKELSLRLLELGTPQPEKNHHHLFVSGMTGAGKSLMINCIFNYVYGISINDNFRFKLIDEAQEKRERGTTIQSEAESMTSWITNYTLHWQEGFRIPYSLSIIDTPGFGDTRGNKQDEKIVEQMRAFFENDEICPTKELTGMVFVIKASDSRLGADQKYTMDQVVNVFGKDMTDNIFINFTFADYNEPPALAVIQKHKFPYTKELVSKYNSGYIYADKSDVQVQAHWSEAEINLYQFLNCVENRVVPVSLNMTKEVLKERDSLKKKLNEFRLNIINKMKRVEEVQMHINEAIKWDRPMSDFYVEITKQVCSFEGCSNKTRSCPKCEINCDPNYTDYAIFSLFKTAFCTCARCGCHLDIHNVSFSKYVMRTVTEKVLATDVYNQNRSIAVSKRQLALCTFQEYKDEKEKVWKLLTDAIKCSNRLDEIGVKNKKMTLTMYITTLKKNKVEYDTNTKGYYNNLIERARYEERGQSSDRFIDEDEKRLNKMIESLK